MNVRTNYRVICMSLYNGDLELFDRHVERLRGRGFTRASRSSLLRTLLRKVNLDELTEREIDAALHEPNADVNDRASDGGPSGSG